MYILNLFKLNRLRDETTDKQYFPAPHRHKIPTVNIH